MNSMSETKLKQVWHKAKIGCFDPSIWRKDYAGAWIKWDEYGKQTDFGWTVDHNKPKSKGGDDLLDNLQPLHWKNNEEKGDDYPQFNTIISSGKNKDGNDCNVEKRQSWRSH